MPNYAVVISVVMIKYSTIMCYQICEKREDLYEYNWKSAKQNKVVDLLVTAFINFNNKFLKVGLQSLAR
jgi:hypothetical protein